MKTYFYSDKQKWPNFTKWQNAYVTNNQEIWLRLSLTSRGLPLDRSRWTLKCLYSSLVNW